MEEPVKKPPLGLKPEWMHDENRTVEISVAITLYLGEGKEIPTEWVKEYNKLAKKCSTRAKSKLQCPDT